MTPYIKAVAKLKDIYEWFNFANDTVNFLGIVQRAAVATAAVAVVGGAGVGAMKGYEAVAQNPQERAIKKAIATSVPDIAPDVRAQVMKVNSENTYSRAFLYEIENRALLTAIVAICREGNALPAQQCDDADRVHTHLLAQEEFRRNQQKAEEMRKKISTDGIIPR